MNTMLQMPYGAYELKRAYQKNMLMGTASMIIITGLVVFAVWLYSTLTYVEDDGSDPIGVGIKLTLLPPPSIDNRRPPQIKVDKPKAPEVQAAIGIPVPVDDDELADEDEQTLYTREQKFDLYPPTLGGEGEGGSDNFVIDGDIADEELPPEVFIPYEKFPELIHEVLPEYPRLAEEAGFAADVWVQVLINKQGRVVKAQAVKCTRPGLGFEEEAVRAAKKCTYRPAIQNGDPMACWISYKIEFVQQR